MLETKLNFQCLNVCLFVLKDHNETKTAEWNQWIESPMGRTHTMFKFMLQFQFSTQLGESAGLPLQW